MRLKSGAGILLFLFLIASAPLRAQNEAQLPAGFSSKDTHVEGLKLHYAMGGHGPAVILLHGFAETSRMWTPILPVLGEKFTVIAPDLPGIGDSSIPAKGINMKDAAISIHSLVRSLGIEKARVVGHDIGLMVAYAYAAQFPSEVEKLAVIDACLPGVEGWEPIYNNPSVWHFRFNGPKPEALVAGRESIYFSFFWDDLAADKNRSLPEADRKAYIAAYSRPGRMRAAWQYFVSWPQTAKDFAELSRTKLTMPVLSIGGERSLGKQLGQQMKLVASDVTVIVLPATGHWILEERPKETTDALVKFL
jgi:pimeloyl-ACP methyl ester carboxylesterase